MAPSVWYGNIVSTPTTRGAIHMSSVACPKVECKREVLPELEIFFKNYIGERTLWRAGALKKQGVSSVDVMLAIMGSVFSRVPLSQNLRSDQASFPLSKDVVYRFLNNAKTNWEKLLLLVTIKIVSYLRTLTDAGRKTALIIDDTSYYRDRSKKVDCSSKCYDHSKGQFYTGYTGLTLGWSDGASFVPLKLQLLCSSSEKNIKFEKKGRFTPEQTKRRRAAKMDKPSLCIQWLKELSTHNLAHYVLFDSWFAHPRQIVEIKEIGYDVVAMLQARSKQRFLYKNQLCSVSQISSMIRKFKTKGDVLNSVNVKILTGEHGPVDARIVFVKNRRSPSNWIALISTDVSLSADEIVQLYGKRWDIEVFFKTVKSTLNMSKEFFGRSLDGITAHATLVFLRYAFLSLERRRHTDERTLGSLFRAMCDEQSDVTLKRAIEFLIFEMSQFLIEIIPDELGILKSVMLEFLAGIPQKLRAITGLPRCET